MDMSISSASIPAAVAIVPDRLEARDGHRVLEIGSGYNGGVMCHRLGAQNVVPVDIDSELVEVALTLATRFAAVKTPRSRRAHRTGTASARGCAGAVSWTCPA